MSYAGKAALFAAFAFAGLWPLNTAARADEAPAWAYPVNPPNLPVAKDDGQMRTLPGSKAQFSFEDLRNFFSPPDWYPDDHPEMPSLVAHGTKPGAFACGFCHLPSGLGRPENAPLAGLPAAYIIRQVQDMASGARKSVLPDRYPQQLMTDLGKQAATDPGLAAAAEYFASLKPKKMNKVIEAENIPKIDISHWILKLAEGGGTEPLGMRLVEVPDDFVRFNKRDGHLSYTTYVPKGSIAKGEELVKTGGDGKTVACAACHGPDLRGLGPVPPIAGRSPSYLIRQLYDFKAGARDGEWAVLMKPVVAGLDDEDMIAIIAYVAAQEP